MDEYYNKTAAGYNELHGEEQKKKLAYAKEFISVNKEDKLLDLGCGSGISSDWDCNVVGIDPNINLLKQSSRELILGSGDDLPFKENSFDYVVSLTAFHHVKDYDHGLSEIKRVCTKLAILSVIKKSKSVPALRNLADKYELKEFEHEKDYFFVMNCA